MVTIDAAKPAKKKRKTTPPRTEKNINDKDISPGASPRKTEKPLPETKKRGLLWLMVGLITIIIFVAWIFIFQQTATTNNSNTPDGLAKIKNSISELWDTIKTDILKIKKTATNENTNINAEKIKELEDKVFPQFNDPTRQ